MSTIPVDADDFPSRDDLRAWTAVFGEAGLRNTGSDTHSDVTDWIIEALRDIPGVEVSTTPVDMTRWTPPAGDLVAAATVTVGGVVLPLASAVPYSKPDADADADGLLEYIGTDEVISEDRCAGRIVVRDVVLPPLPMTALSREALHSSSDLTDPRRADTYRRPFLAPLHEEIIRAAEAGAAGVLFAFDVDDEVAAGYFDPHHGVHYPIPAAFLGRQSRQPALEAAQRSEVGTLSVRARAEPAISRNVHAALPGKTSARIVVVSHTDGATWVQENGPAAILALARYFSALPLDQRRYSLEFVLTTAHLHMSKEGSHHYAEQLDREFDDGTVAAVIALEHLGAREILPDDDGNLRYTGLGELLLWAVGPSDTLRDAAVTAAQHRDLDGTLITPGFGSAKPGFVPEYQSFGGIGSYYHQRLLPTMALISGPWSLWAPSFGEDAVDFERMRQQVLAVADCINTLLSRPLEDVVGNYSAYRRARQIGAPGQVEKLPAEFFGQVSDASDHDH